MNDYAQYSYSDQKPTSNQFTYSTGTKSRGKYRQRGKNTNVFPQRLHFSKDEKGDKKFTMNKLNTANNYRDYSYTEKWNFIGSEE